MGYMLHSAYSLSDQIGYKGVWLSLWMILCPGGVRNFIEPGQKGYRKLICDIIYINSYKSK